MRRPSFVLGKQAPGQAPSGWRREPLSGQTIHDSPWHWPRSVPDLTRYKESSSDKPVFSVHPPKGLRVSG
ncbi:hypothetical protein ASPBRDRAFT_300550 [Aspergillus brasiliensis CBS 101740]|uniref:Uncharacterized protein n=1 Tax=Aspergillus brasiliensis (strain CBS 101740 / IMI 381727 / IBT 21946) TaxID=767769 RepID=A0A1L9U9L1_ASPBC|nr:hypothetical protein ASPBRDRAFT_300550 [Aspergillus brasiliensis CBS 101740]